MDRKKMWSMMMNILRIQEVARERMLIIWQELFLDGFCSLWWFCKILFHYMASAAGLLTLFEERTNKSKWTATCLESSTDWWNILLYRLYQRIAWQEWRSLWWILVRSRYNVQIFVLHQRMILLKQLILIFQKDDWSKEIFKNVMEIMILKYGCTFS